MIDPAAQPVTHQELDDWLRSTEVDDNVVNDNSNNNEPPNATQLAATPAPSSECCSQQEHSSVGMGDSSHLSLGDSAHFGQLGDQISPLGNNEDISPNQIIGNGGKLQQSGRGNIDRDAVLSHMQSPMQFAANTNANNNTQSMNMMDCSTILQQQQNQVMMTTTLTRRDSVESCQTHRTNASSDTVPIRNSILMRSSTHSHSSSASMVSSPVGLRRAVTTSSSTSTNGMALSSPYQKEFGMVSTAQNDGTSGGNNNQYARSVSLPLDYEAFNAELESSGTTVLSHRHNSMPTSSVSSSQQRSMSCTTAKLHDTSSIIERQASIDHPHELGTLQEAFQEAMTQSQRSQDHNIHSRKSMDLMRETNRTRELLLGTIVTRNSGVKRYSLQSHSTSSRNPSSSNRESHSSHMSTCSTSRASCSSSGRRDSLDHLLRASIGLGRKSNNGRSNSPSMTTSSSSSKSTIMPFSNHFMRSKHMIESDMRNIMLRTMEEEMLEGKRRDSFNNNSASCGGNGGYWRPASKHHRTNRAPQSPSLTSSYPSKQELYPIHHNFSQQGNDKEVFDQESAVKAELERIARELR